MSSPRPDQMARFWSIAGNTIEPMRVDHTVRSCFLRRTSAPITTWKKRSCWVVAVLGLGDRLCAWSGMLRTGSGPRSSKRVSMKSDCNTFAHPGDTLGSAPGALAMGGKVDAQSTRAAWPSL